MAGSFLDKVKSAAQEAATRTREGIEELQLKRELGQAYGEIGRKAVELVESGEVSHAALAEGAEKVRGLKTQLDALGAEPTEDGQPAEEPDQTAS